MPFDRLNHLDLCSGIGGFALGFEWAELSNPIGLAIKSTYETE
jgi:site-specific DNA-cytosine methylase